MEKRLEENNVKNENNREKRVSERIQSKQKTNQQN